MESESKKSHSATKRVEMEHELKEHSDEDISQQGLRPVVRPKTITQSFRYAVDGILDVFRTQRHMRFHFVTVILVLLAALLLDLSKRDILIITFVISMVLIAEMFNTAIEAVVDLVVQTYHPLAKFAKDAAAGAVLIATVTAVLVGVMLSIGGDTSFGQFGVMRPEDPNVLIKVLLAGIILLIAVTIVKVLGTKGKLLSGGIVSGHAAAGFFFAATILFISRNALAALMGVLIALLVAQSRVEAKIHSLQEVVAGALMAMLLTAAVYWFPNVWTSLAKHLPFGLGVF